MRPVIGFAEMTGRFLFFATPVGAIMKRYTCLFCLSCIGWLMISCASGGVVDNTFPATVQNDSDFTVEIDGTRIAPHSTTTHSFPLHDSALYDGWPVEYSVPLTDSVIFAVREMLHIADGQRGVVIENPGAESIEGCYVVVQNAAAKSMQLTDGGNNKIFPCYTSGIINGSEVERGKPVYMVAAGTSAVCELERNSPGLFVSEIGRGADAAALPCAYRCGFVYTVRCDAHGVRLVDARPIPCMGEGLWSKRYDGTMLPRAVLQVKGRIFVLGTETFADNKENLYRSGFLQCLDRRGGVLWKREYGAKGADTYLYDMALFGGTQLLVAGQRIDGDKSGLLLVYDLEGKLLRTVSVAEAVGLDSVTVLSGGTYTVSGYTADGAAVTFSVTESLSYTRRAPLVDWAQVQDFVASPSRVVAGRKGSLYVGGETPYQERPAATVAGVSSDGAVSTLYTAQEPFSFVADLLFDEERDVLVATGAALSADGSAGTPFIRCIDAAGGTILWESFARNVGYAAASRLAPCDDYGFVQLFVSADAEGNVCAPCALVRTNAVGAQ